MRQERIGIKSSTLNTKLAPTKTARFPGTDHKSPPTCSRPPITALAAPPTSSMYMHDLHAQQAEKCVQPNQQAAPPRSMVTSNKPKNSCFGGSATDQKDLRDIRMNSWTPRVMVMTPTHPLSTLNVTESLLKLCPESLSQDVRINITVYDTSTWGASHTSSASL